MHTPNLKYTHKHNPANLLFIIVLSEKEKKGEKLIRVFGLVRIKYPGIGIWPGEGSGSGRHVHVGQPVASTAEAPVCQRSQLGCTLSTHDYRERTFQVIMFEFNVERLLT